MEAIRSDGTVSHPVVALSPVRVLLPFAKHLFVAAISHAIRLPLLASETGKPALLALTMATEASAHSRQFYDGAGKRIGSATTDSSGTVTNYDARGKVISREMTTGNQTTIYDASGRNVGRSSGK